MPILSTPVDSVSASWRKRKRDFEDAPTLARPSSLVPFRVDHSDLENNLTLPLIRYPNEGSDISLRPRCIPRKRRHLPPPCLSLPSHHQNSFLAPNVHASAQDPYSPPVSPKTLAPLSYPSASASALRPCHICHRRPTTRQVLDAYADCGMCGKRACFICLRQCDSPACLGVVNVSIEARPESDLCRPSDELHDKDDRLCRKVCSSCAIEGVTETGIEIVQCLDCVRRHSASWTTRSFVSGRSLNETSHEKKSG